jgi:hypothetical protein
MSSRSIAKSAKTALHWLLIPLTAVAITLWPTLSSGVAVLQTDPGDTLLNHYFLEHAYQHVRDGQLFNPEHFWSPDYFWPVKDTLAWSDHLIGPAVLYGALRTLLLSDPYQAYAGWVSLTLLLNYVAIRKALQVISPAGTATWLSIIALITSFSPAITSQLGHPQLISLFLVGPILVLCHKLITTSDPKDFSINDWLLLGFWLLSNGIFNIYIFVYACYGALICTFIHLIRRLKAQNWQLQTGEHWKHASAWFALVVVSNAIIYRPYLETLDTFGKRSGEEIAGNLPKPASYLFANDNWLLPPLFTHGRFPEGWVSGVEQQLFPGWLFLILLAAACITAFRKQANDDYALKLWLIAVAGMLLGSISIMDISLWPWLSKLLPGASSLRASSRVGLMIVLFAAPALALASQHWTTRRSRPKDAVGMTAGLAAAFASIWAIGQPSFSLNEWRKEASSINQALIDNNCDVFWNEWSDGPYFRAHVQAMHIQQNTGIPTVNGLSGHFPKHQWPIEQPSGEGAYAWIALNNPGDYHRLRDQPDSLKRCIATWDPTSQTTDIRNVEVLNGMPSNLISTLNSMFEGNEIEILSDSNRLFVRYSNDSHEHPRNIPLLLTRDGRPIPAVRGEFEITNVKREGNNLFITDTSVNEELQYVWRVNATNGVFIDQSMLKLNNR